jgi:hypothetical protein
MLSALHPPPHTLALIQHCLEEAKGLPASEIDVSQSSDGSTTASLQGISMGAASAAVYWLGDSQDGHAVLREVAYHRLFVAPTGETDLPIVVVQRFGDGLKRYLAYEGRFPMQWHPTWDWLVISLEGDIAGWFQNREITTLPTPRPQRESGPIIHLRR